MENTTLSNEINKGIDILLGIESEDNRTEFEKALDVLNGSSDDISKGKQAEELEK